MAPGLTIAEGDEQAAINKAREARGEEVDSEEKPAEESEEKPAEESTEEESKDEESTEEESKDEDNEKSEESEDESTSIDPQALYNEWAENGELSEENRTRVEAALEAAGLPKDLLDTHLAGLAALRAQAESSAYEQVGGKDNYVAMTEWAAKNLSEDEIAAFDSAITSGNPGQASLAIDGLYARFAKAGGTTQNQGDTTQNRGEPSLKNAGRRGSGRTPIKSRAELAKLMADPRYKNDPGFRAQVIDDLKTSRESGQYLTTD